MAPKKAVDKNKLAAKQKAVEDKTFGLKNKNKSIKVQKMVQNMEKNVTVNSAAQAEEKKKKRLAEEAAAKEINALFTVAIKQPKVPDGVDPKSIVCEYFRHGQCTKGNKCKYSHDLSVERKGPKIDMFTDQRNLGAGGEEEGEGMEDWDQATLERAIEQKHANENKPTGISCKFFVDAVEKRLYGWFWKCPNGDECKYRHALPPNYVLKSQMKELLEEEARNTRDISETIEEERQKVVAKTPITEQTFRAWHAKKTEAKSKAREAAEEERRKKGIMNGREIFMQDGFVGFDDASAADDSVYEREEDEEVKIREMLAQAQAQALEAQRLRAEGGGAGADDDGEGEGNSGAGPSGSNGGGAGPSTHLALGKGEAAELFDDEGDEDDDEEGMEEEDDDDGDEEEDLDGLAAQVKGMHVKGAGGG